MNTGNYAQRLIKLLSRLQKEEQSLSAFSYTSPLECMIYAFFMWEAGPQLADTSVKFIQQNTVDYNELRVCFPEEIVDIIGNNYPRALERCISLHTVLNDIYKREDDVRLDQIVNMPITEARNYLDTLKGMIPFVAARVILLSLGGIALPLDDRLYSCLKRDSVIPDDSDMPSIQKWIEQLLLPNNLQRTYLLLENWADNINDQLLTIPHV